MKKLFIIGGGEMQVPVIKKAKELGHFCIVSDLNPEAPGFKYADAVVNISTTDLDQTLMVAKEYRIDGILTTSDYPVRTVANTCEKLGLKGLSSYSANLCTDKFEQREVLDKHNYYTPDHFLIHSADEIEEHRDEFVFPLIVKPIDSSASRGVKKVVNYEELLEAFDSAVKYSFEKKVIVEEFIDGPEYSVESLTQDGETHIVAITEKHTFSNEESSFVESMHIVPADLTAETEKIMKDYVRSIIKCFRIDNSSTHTELKLSLNGPVLIEIGARLGGDFITSDLVPLATGINMLENVIKIALNEKINVSADKTRYAGIGFISSDNYQTAENLVAQKHEVLVRYDLKPYKKVILTNSLERLGYLIAVSAKRDEVVDFLNFK